MTEFRGVPTEHLSHIDALAAQVNLSRGEYLRHLLAIETTSTSTESTSRGSTNKSTSTETPTVNLTEHVVWDAWSCSPALTTPDPRLPGSLSAD